jgi:hypothetical protein
MHESSAITCSSHEQVDARKVLFSKLFDYPASDEEKERSLGLFIRGSLMARILATHEIYQQIVGIPGSIIDMGTWRGQTAVLCENFRAILEPMNFQRRIHAFDTFSGYCGFEENEAKLEKTHNEGKYSTGESYAELLRELLVLHEQNNAMGHNFGKHRVWAGDCRDTIKEFAREYPGEIISLAWFDLNSLKPTEAAFSSIKDRLIPGSIVAFWQLTRHELGSEGMHYIKNILGEISHTLHRCSSYPSLCYIKISR